MTKKVTNLKYQKYGNIRTNKEAPRNPKGERRYSCMGQ